MENLPTSSENHNAFYKPPTNEEIRDLQETQNLFNSSLLKLQISEVLNEVEVKKRAHKKIDKYLHEFHSLLTNVPQTKSFKLNNFDEVISTNYKVPHHFDPPSTKGMMKCGPPSDVKVIGSYMLATCIKHDLNVDLMLVLPEESMQEKDYLNERYFRKRAIYLSYIAQNISQDPLVEKCSYVLNHVAMPILVVYPKGDLSKHFKLHIYICPPRNFFKELRFMPETSNLRRTFFDRKTDQVDMNNLPSSRYNHRMSCDIQASNQLEFMHECLSEFESGRQAVILLKVWLRQRNLCQGPGCFGGFIVSMLICYLLKKQKINRLMSCYQIVRITFNFIACTDWINDGISLHDQIDIQTYKQHNEVVFVNNNGKVNLCSAVAAAVYLQVKHEAHLSLRTLDLSPTSNPFNAVFMTQVPFVQKFDQFVHFKDVSALQLVADKLSLRDQVADCSGNFVEIVFPHIMRTLRRALSNRVQLLGICLQESKEWALDHEPAPWQQQSCSIGLLLDAEHFITPIEKGPLANDPSASEFREFWGDVSDLRRFQDGSIREAVLWRHDNQLLQRTIPIQIIKHALQRHCDIKNEALSHVTEQMESEIMCKKKSHSIINKIGAGDERFSRVVTAYNELCSLLRNVKNLPLSINSLQAISPGLRFTEIFPPVPMYTGNAKCLQNNAVPTYGKRQFYVSALEVICQVEGSGKWPSDADAIKRVKAAFHVALAEELRASKIICSASTDHIDIFYNGYVFRVYLCYHREITILRTVTTDSGMVKVHNTPQATQLQMKTLLKPWLHSAMHGLHQRHRSFGITCRLAKKWVKSQYLLHHIPDDVVELLCAYVYTNPHPFTVPNTSNVGFLRFLWFVSNYDFKNKPLIVSINNEVPETECAEIIEHFTKNRDTLPPLFIATVTDKKSSPWTAEKPIPTILHRLKQLAMIAYNNCQISVLKPTANVDFSGLFQSTLSVYDIVINIEIGSLPQVMRSERTSSQKTNSLMPLLNFNVAEFYLRDLEDTYHQWALFFYDGGNAIGVLWRPNAFQNKRMKVGNLCDGVMRSGDEVCLNVEAFIEDLKLLGKGIVTSIDIKSEKWNK